MSQPPSNLGTFVLIANPTAGRGRGDEALRVVEARLAAAGVPLEVWRTTGPGDAVSCAAEAAQNGAGVVVAIGGDGTLHEVVNGLLEHRTEVLPPALGLVPVGTGNDYARMLGIPGRDPAAAAEVLLAGAVREVDVGAFEGGDQGPEYFCNNIGLAFMAAANAAHEETRFLPGRLSYSLGGLLSYVRYRAERLAVTVDGVTVEGRWMIVQIGIGKYCGGGVCLTPDAKLDNGRMDVCLVAARSKLRGFLQWPRLAKGERLDDMTVLAGKRLRIMGQRGFLMHADGEVRRVPTGVLVVRLIPAGLRVLSRR